MLLAVVAVEVVAVGVVADADLEAVAVEAVAEVDVEAVVVEAEVDVVEHHPAVGLPVGETGGSNPMVVPKVASGLLGSPSQGGRGCRSQNTSCISRQGPPEFVGRIRCIQLEGIHMYTLLPHRSRYGRQDSRKHLPGSRRETPLRLL